MRKNQPIGVFDSGIGGLTVVKEIIKQLPSEDIIYFGDCLRAPYGSRPHYEIISFMRQTVKYLFSRNVKTIIIACNTTTALGLEIARLEFPVPIVGMNTGARIALQHSSEITVLATEATVASRNHEKTIKSFNSKAQVHSIACPELVKLIEQPQINDLKIEHAVKSYLGNNTSDSNSIILGCTHYPLVADIIKKSVSDKCKIIDPAAATVIDAIDLLELYNIRSDSTQVGKVELNFSAGIEKAHIICDKVLPERTDFIFNSLILS